MITALGVILAAGGSLSFAPAAMAASANGPEGQTVTVSKVDGLDPDGETITVHGEGFDLTKGIYVVVCINTGAGQQPTPCLGGADMEGGGGSSAWISSNPPSYGEGLAVPRGVWHLVHVEEPGQLVHITPGPGGEHRPLP